MTQSEPEIAEWLAWLLVIICLISGFALGVLAEHYYPWLFAGLWQGR